MYYRDILSKRVTLAFDDGNARESSIRRWRGEKMESRDGFTRETRFDSVRFDDLAFSLLVNAPQIRICPASTRSQPFFLFSFFFFQTEAFNQRVCGTNIIEHSCAVQCHFIIAFHRSPIPLKPWESLELSFVNEGDARWKTSYRVSFFQLNVHTCIKFRARHGKGVLTLWGPGGVDLTGTCEVF